MSALTRVLAAGRIRTRDLGGSATTTEFAGAICRELEYNSGKEPASA
jgi:isocitrate/isopropylmalate dehydrogenase